MNKEIHRELVIKVAQAYNNLDYKEIESIAAEDIRYTSQSVLSSLEGKNSVVTYLKEKFNTIIQSDNHIFAELANMGIQSDWTIQISDLNKGDSCILLSQGTRNNKGAIILIHVNTLNQIDRINICTVVPHWSTAIGTGIYPL